MSLRLPDPEAVHVPPPAPTQVHVAVSDAGNVSATVAPTALSGPALLAVIVYVTDPPAVTVVTPSVFVIDRSADPPDPAVAVLTADTLGPTISSSATSPRQAPNVTNRLIESPLARKRHQPNFPQPTQFQPAYVQPTPDRRPAVTTARAEREVFGSARVAADANHQRS